MPTFINTFPRQNRGRALSQMIQTYFSQVLPITSMLHHSSTLILVAELYHHWLEAVSERIGRENSGRTLDHGD